MVEKINVRVHRETINKDDVLTEFNVDVELGAGLTQREQILLFNAAKKCEVSEIVSGKFEFSYIS